MKPNEFVDAKVIKAYLVDGLSHREIQREILNVPAPNRGGGFKAMQILHSYGIKGEKKLAVTNNSLADELAEATGGYREALLLLKKYFYN